LVHVHDSANCAVLSDDLSQEPPFEIEYFAAAHLGIEENLFRNKRFDHRFAPLTGLSQPFQDSHPTAFHYPYCNSTANRKSVAPSFGRRSRVFGGIAILMACCRQPELSV